MSGYVSNNSSELSNFSFEDDSPIVAQNARPHLNEKHFDKRTRYPSVIPAGFKAPNRRLVHSRVSQTRPPFFQNAKPARMLERGLVRTTLPFLTPNDEGVLIIKDSIEMDVKVVKNPPDMYMTRFNGKGDFTFLRLDSNPENEKIMLIPAEKRFTEWDFYKHETAVPFVPRAGSLEAASHTTVERPAAARPAAARPAAAAAPPTAAAAPPTAAAVAPPTAVNVVGNEGGCFGAWCWANQTRKRGGYKGKNKYINKRSKKTRRRSKSN
jgi:hypothetical protein